MTLPPQIAQAHSLVSTGRAPEAVLLLGRLAAANDGPALFQLAQWRREGRLVPLDLAMARELYRRAGEAGFVEGMRRHIAFLAIGVGGSRDWAGSLRLLARLARTDPAAKRQLSLLRSMKLTKEGDPVSTPEGELLSESPRVIRFRRCFSVAECYYLGQAAVPLLQPAVTFDERLGRHIRNPIRTSESAGFPWVAENPAIHALNRRLAAISGTDVSQGEPLQVLRYSPGQEYRAHIDAIPGMENQRILTMLVYLNDGYEGGETQFLRTGLTVPAERGDAILFHNVDVQGRPDPEALHAGLPVRKGVKLLASRWIRARPFTD